MKKKSILSLPPNETFFITKGDIIQIFNYDYKHIFSTNLESCQDHKLNKNNEKFEQIHLFSKYLLTLSFDTYYYCE